MSKTWADDQFDKLEAAYDEVPIEAKARIAELEAALNEVADKWAQAQIKAENLAKENRLLKAHDGSRWFELFGTPERAAKTMVGKCGDCCECILPNKFRHACVEGCLLSIVNEDGVLLEWLRGEGES